MRKLRIIEHISLDGVIQAPGGKGEDGDYPYGGWSAQYDDPELGEAIVAAHRRALRSAAGSANLRYLERPLAESEGSVRGRYKRGDEIHRDPQAGQS